MTITVPSGVVACIIVAVICLGVKYIQTLIFVSEVQDDLLDDMVTQNTIKAHRNEYEEWY